MWTMPMFFVKDGKKEHEYVVKFHDNTIPPVTLSEGAKYVVKPGPWPHVGRSGVFVPSVDTEVMLDENQDQEAREFLFYPDPRSLELVNLH